MTLTHIYFNLILRILDGARRVIGEEAVKIANSIEGLKVTNGNEIVVTRDPVQILKKLIKEYESELHGEIILDLDVRVNVKSSAGKD